jgi:hypothetical protein
MSVHIIKILSPLLFHPFLAEERRWGEANERAYSVIMLQFVLPQAKGITIQASMFPPVLKNN